MARARTFMMALAAVVAFVALILPSVAAAQSTTEIYGKGEPAERTARAAAMDFVASYVERFNAGDPAVVDLMNPRLWYQFSSDTRDGAVDYLQNVASPVTLHEVRDVRAHGTGHLSVEVTYSGWVTTHTFYTERWYLLPFDGGDYIIDDGAARTPRAPEGMASAEVDVTLSTRELSVATAELPPVDLLILRVENVEESAILSTGVYVLPDTIVVEEERTELVPGDLEGIEYLGPTPVEPDFTRTYGFLVEPGARYIIQQFTLDATGGNPQASVGTAFATTLMIRPDGS